MARSDALGTDFNSGLSLIFYLGTNYRSCRLETLSER